jgi:hypothetical protein
VGFIWSVLTSTDARPRAPIAVEALSHRPSPVNPRRGLVPERAPGANDKALRLLDLDQEGVWAELIYPSLGIWTSSIRDPLLLSAGAKPSMVV